MYCFAAPHRARRCGTAAGPARPIVRRLLQKIREKIVGSAGRVRGKAYTIQGVPEMPDYPKEFTLYLIGCPQAWSAALLCPCGCQEMIHISLLANDSPSWSIRINRQNEPTLEPSIWRKDGCLSHFFIRRGRIIWYK